MKYVADDGTEFETEKECLEYECLLADIESSFMMYDEDLNKLSPEDYDNCYYINVIRRANDVGDYLYHQYGIDVEPTDIAKEGIYYRNNDGRFKSVDALFQRIRKKLRVMSGRDDL